MAFREDYFAIIESSLEFIVERLQIGNCKYNRITGFAETSLCTRLDNTWAVLNLSA